MLLCSFLLHHRRVRSGMRAFKDFPVIPKTIATLLALCAFSANLASAQGTGFKGTGFNGTGFNGEVVAASTAATHGGGFHGRGSYRRSFGRYGFVDGYRYDNNSAFPDWYGISSGYDECPLFRQRVMTRDGWRVKWFRSVKTIRNGNFWADLRRPWRPADKRLPVLHMGSAPLHIGARIA
jgi:hypothetical protein